MTSPKGEISRVTGPLYGEITGHRGIPLIKASHGAMMFSLICTAPLQTIEMQVIGSLLTTEKGEYVFTTMNIIEPSYNMGYSKTL